MFLRARDSGLVGLLPAGHALIHGLAAGESLGGVVPVGDGFFSQLPAQEDDLTLDLAVKSVGLRGLIAPHPLERRVRDLTTYLRQPSPDADQQCRVARACCDDREVRR